MVVIPETEWLATGRTGAFSGSITVEDWSGEFLKGFKYQRGQVTAQFTTEKPKELKNGRVSVMQLMECGYTDWYTCVCVGTYCNCEYNYTETHYCWVNAGGGEGAGGGGPTGGDYGSIPPSGGGSGPTASAFNPDTATDAEVEAEIRKLFERGLSDSEKLLLGYGTSEYSANLRKYYKDARQASESTISRYGYTKSILH